MSNEAPEVFLRWERFVGWLFDHTSKFPRAVRMSVTLRIENLALDVFEALVEARYDVDRSLALRRAGIGVEKLRLLLRLACNRRYLPPASLEYAVVELDLVGRQVGGWQKSSR